MKTAAVVVFPGSNCDRDAIIALKKCGFDEVIKIWYQEKSLPINIELIIIPGGFSYGDYLRSGAMASISNIIKEIKKFSEEGGLVLGICNGFQILTEANLLPGALIKNKNNKFICKNTFLKICNNKTIFTQKYQQNKIIKIPVAHMDGRYHIDKEDLKILENNNQIAFKYCTQNGDINETSNFNGSLENIAGVFNKNKNILGMMPHPERAIDSEIGLIDGIKMLSI
jgi:phosphoribosylformylglycinamidine synthase I